VKTVMLPEVKNREAGDLKGRGPKRREWDVKNIDGRKSEDGVPPFLAYYVMWRSIGRPSESGAKHRPKTNLVYSEAV